MSGELPEGWLGQTLGTLVEFKYGKGLPEKTRTAGSVPVYGSNGVVGSHDAAVTNGPTIVIGRKGSVGEVHLSNGPCWPIDTTYFMESFGPFIPAFLAYQLQHLDLAQQESSTAIPGLSREDAYRRDALVPPLAEQKRIVEKVEALLADVNRARDRLAKVPLLLKRFRQSILAAACSGKLTEEWRAQAGRDGDPDAPWPLSSVAEVCSIVVDCPHSTPKWTAAGEVCLRTTNFFATGLDLREVRYVSSETYRERVLRLTPDAGDVVYSREGGILGIACVIPAGLRACLGQRMMLMRPDRRKVRPAFLASVLNAPSTLAVVRELTGGTAAPHLNVGDIKQFAVPIPPGDEQDEILARLEKFFRLADEIEKRVAATLRLGQGLPSVLLARAFSGELVPTEAELARAEGRGYEPAATLLARVSSTRSATSRRSRNPSKRAEL